MLDVLSVESGLAEAMVTLLRLFPGEVHTCRTVVMTTRPELWSSIAEGPQIVDVSQHVNPDVANGHSRPDTQKLAAELAGGEPDSIIIDFTVPTGVCVLPLPAVRDPASPFAAVVPGDLPPIDTATVDIRDILLAWAASNPSVRAVTATAPSSLTIDPSTDWLRQHLSAHPHLCAVLELSVDLLQPLNQPATCVLYFGGNRQDIYFDE